MACFSMIFCVWLARLTGEEGICLSLRANNFQMFIGICALWLHWCPLSTFFLLPCVPPPFLDCVRYLHNREISTLQSKCYNFFPPICVHSNTLCVIALALTPKPSVFKTCICLVFFCPDFHFQFFKPVFWGFLAVPRCLRDLSSRIKDWTQALGSESAKS